MSLQEQYQDFAENLQEQCCAGEARRMRLREEKLSRMKRMRESILHPFSDKAGAYQSNKRLIKYGIIGGLAGKAVGHPKKGAAIGALVGHVVNQIPYIHGEAEHIGRHVGGIVGTKKAFLKGYHSEK